MDERERERHDRIVELQGNVNLFVLEPERVGEVWKLRN